MSTKPLTTWRLALENVKRKKLRTVCLVATVCVLSFVLFGGAILTDSLSNGFESMHSRLGADLIVVPSGYKGQMEAVLLKGEPNYFYFPGTVLDSTAKTAGVERATAQFFLASLSASCCTSKVQLIAFSPQTDFVIQPWVQGQYQGVLPEGQVLAGSDILLEDDGTIRLFKTKYHVAARLAKTATGLDSSVFMSRKTIEAVMQNARALGYNFISDSEPAGSISSVLVKLKADADADKVSEQIRKANPGVDVIASQTMISGTANAVAELLGYVRVFGAGLLALAVIVLAAVFSVTFHERIKEFAILRALGATRAKLSSLVLLESLAVSAAGGVLGVGLASLVVFPFSTYIGNRLQLPYLQPDFGTIALALAVSLLVSFVIGPLASSVSAIRVARAQTYQAMREGE